MDYTTLPTQAHLFPEWESVPVHSLYQALQSLTDPRRKQGQRYSLALVLCLLILAKLAGQKTLSGATQWVRHRRVALAERFGLKRSSMPCQTTYCPRIVQRGC
jgi:DDE_Tnp_1-associated